MKETFIIRTEWFAAIAKLSSEEQAVIFRNLFEYHKGNLEGVELPTFPVELVWGLIEPTLQRHIDSYDKRRDTSVENGRKGGRPKKEEPKKPNPEPNNHVYESDSEFESGYDTGCGGKDSDTGGAVMGSKVVPLPPKAEVAVPFEEFWNAYDKKVSPDKCRAKWEKLTRSEQRAAMEYIPQYKAAQPDKKYRKNPETFLNNKSWRDEIISDTPVIQMQMPVAAVAGDDIRLNREKYLGIDDLMNQ